MTRRSLRYDHVWVVLLGLMATALMVATPATPAVADANEAPNSPLASRTLTAGGRMTCTIVTGGGVRCWGGSTYGQLGLGNVDSHGGSPNTMGGNLPPVDLGTGRTATAVSAGTAHTCALLDNGQVKCWGLNDDGRLGQGDTKNRGGLPRQMGDNLPAVDLGTGRTATAIAAGNAHTCALLDTGQIKCWGANSNGQLGVGDSFARGDSANEMGDNLPAVDLGSGRTATAVSASGSVSCAILDDATVKCWGEGGKGQLGVGTTYARGDNADEMGDNLPAVDLGTGRTATAISVGATHVCALLDDGQVKCWGSSASGQLGLGTTTIRGTGPGEMGDNLPAVDLGTGRTATAISAGLSETCALLDDATVKCWGSNSAGELGLGATTARGDNADEMGDNLPAVDLGTGRTATAVTTGGDPGGNGKGWSCAVLDDASIKCWGSNNFGQLGIGDAANRGDGPSEMGDQLPTVNPAGSGITGSVVDSLSTVGATVPSALVAALRTTDLSVAGGGVADIFGRFTFAVPPGQYYLYAIDRTGAHVPSFIGAPTALTVPAGLTPVTATAALVPTAGSVAGAVTESGTGAPVSGAFVLVIEHTSGAPARVVQADSSGHYAVTGLREGSYDLAFIDPGGGHAPRYHGGASTPFTATPVSVSRGGSVVADQAIPVQPVVGGTALLSGFVFEDAGNLLPGVLVVALRASDLTVVRAGLSNPTGGFNLYVAPGDYKLLFVDGAGAHAAEWWQDQPMNGLDAATSVTAPGHANTSLSTSMGMISGNVSKNGGALGGAWVVAIGSTGVAGAAVTSYGSGYYSLTGLPVGTYRAAVIDPAGRRFEYWPNAATYVDAVDFVVSAGGNTAVNASM